MAAGDGAPAGTRRVKKGSAIVVSAATDQGVSTDPSDRSMAVSIAGVSTACSKDALASSAEAVRKTLAAE